MASNLYTTPLDILRQMFADTAAFRTWTGAPTPAEAFSDKTFRAVADFPTGVEKLVVIGNMDDALSGTRDAQGGGIGAFKQSVGLTATLIFFDTENQESDTWYTNLEAFTETAGDILKGVLAESGKDGNLLFLSYSGSRAFRTERSNDNYLYVAFEFETGT